MTSLADPMDVRFTAKMIAARAFQLADAMLWQTANPVPTDAELREHF